MKRLTKRNECGNAYYPECYERCYGEGSSKKCNDCDYDEKICETLADYEDTGLTPPEIMKLKERDTAKVAIITGYNRAIGCKVGECPKCGAMTRDYLTFCSECGQRIKWED